MKTLSLPDGKTLLSLEAEARRQGSGIAPESLQGEWWLDQLWSRQGSEQKTTACMLRGIGACLAITVASNTNGDNDLHLRNSVHVGPAVLQFSGPGLLSGKRPLLRFRFERMALLWGDRELWHAALPAPTPQRMPFFALIACEHSGGQGWLAARGRSGGLAAWRLRPAIRPSAPRD